MNDQFAIMIGTIVISILAAFVVGLRTRRLLSSEHLKLRAFAEFCMEDAFAGYDINGGDMQNKLNKLGLIELRPIPPEDSLDGETEHYFLVWRHDDDK